MYELSLNRYRELKHFCLQYHEMKEEIEKLSHEGISDAHDDITASTAVSKADYIYAVRLIEMTAMDTAPDFYESLLKSVTEDVQLHEVTNYIPALDFCRRKFFWLLSERKGV